MDFFPVGSFQEVKPTGAVHVVMNSQLPEPGTLVLIGGALLILSRVRRRLN